LASFIPTLTAQQPENNIVRTTVQALSAVLGGTQSLHTNSFDEALGLPTEKSAEIALRTQQIIGHESGAALTVDPLAGSYYVEYLTDRMEKNILDIMAGVENLCGSVKCVESGYFREEIASSAYKYQKAIESKEQIVVGVNSFTTVSAEIPSVLKVNPDLEVKQIEILRRLKAERDNRKVSESLAALKDAVKKEENIVYPVLEAVENYATTGEISDVLRQEWGEYKEMA